MKRILDLFLLIILVPIVLPFIFFIGFFKLLIDGRPLFYKSQRVGRNAQLFKVYKFRTMVNDPDFIKSEISKIGRSGFEAIPLTSPVYTVAGRIFERYQFVELPQLLNIWKGDMSFVGYRPLPSGHIEVINNTLGADIAHRRSKSMPGITGFAQLSNKFSLSNEERLKIEISEGNFFENSGVMKLIVVYFLLIFLTVVYVFFDKNDYVILLRDKVLD